MLETERIILRPIEESDAPDIFSYRSDEITNQFQGWIPNNIEEVEHFISKNPTDFNTPETWFQLVLEDKNHNKVIGDVGVHFTDQDNLQCEFGCTISKEHQNKGLAKEVITELFDHLFMHLKKHRISASADPRNVASLKLLERLNMRKEAHFVKSYFSKGQWTDDVIYAILKEEWS